MKRDELVNGDVNSATSTVNDHVSRPYSISTTAQRSAAPHHITIVIMDLRKEMQCK